MFKEYKNVNDLSDIWDEIAGDNPFLKRVILRNLEELNPCKQRYHIDVENKIIFVSYKLNIDLFTFSKYLTFKMPINIIGVPMSVSKSGYAYVEKNKKNLLVQYIKSLKGFHVVLNSDEELDLPKGNTLPSYRLKINWKTLNEYFLSQRSHYRYRLNKGLKKFQNVKVERILNNKLFDKEMYKLYCEIFDSSSEKLEKMPIEFFREFPSILYKFTINKETVGFVQLVDNNEELIFLFGGFRKDLNIRYDLYQNMLIQIIHYGVKNGYKYIDFGQTAGETKSKLGGIQSEKYMYAYHSNKFINILIKVLIGRFSYKKYETIHNVFKEELNESSFS